MNTKIKEKKERLIDQSLVVLRRLRILWVVYFSVLLLSFCLFALCALLLVYTVWGSFRGGTDISGPQFYFLLILTIVLGIFFVFVIRPLIILLKMRVNTGMKLERSDNQALFAFIDSVSDKVSSQMNAEGFNYRYPDTDIYVDNDCYVSYHYLKFTDCLFGRKMVLSICLPGIMSMNQSEFEAFLVRALSISDDMQTRIKYLASFWCKAFSDYDNTLHDGSAEVYGFTKGLAWRFAHWVMVILAKPINKLIIEHSGLEILYELYMDNVSAWMSGKDTCIAAIIKNDYLTDKWEEFRVILKNQGRDEGTAPENCLLAFRKFAFDDADFSDDTDIEEEKNVLQFRVDSILRDAMVSESAEEEVNETPALCLFDMAQVHDVFDSTPDEISRKYLGNRKLARK